MSPWGAVLFGVAVAGALVGTAPLPDRWRAVARLPAWLVPTLAGTVAVVSGAVPVGALGGWLDPLGPALAFLLAGVPLAVLLDRLGFFDAGAAVISRRDTSLVGLWIAAALTTALLNLDTTVVLLTPLYIRLARRTGRSALGLALIPLLLANLASLALPVSNLTGLITSEQWSVSTAEHVARVGLPTVVASVVGWFTYRRWHRSTDARATGPDSTATVAASAGATTSPTADVTTGAPTGAPVGGPVGVLVARDRQALLEGGLVVAAVLVGFVAGPSIGLPAWAVALVADVVLMTRTRHVPWRVLPWDSAVLVLALAVVTAAAVPDGLSASLPTGGVGADAVTLGLGVLLANAVNNLPALLAGIHGTTVATATGWAWLVGVSLGPVLTPLGSLANLLWWRSAQEQGVSVRARELVIIGVRVGGPALAAGAASFLVLQAVHG